MKNKEMNKKERTNTILNQKWTDILILLYNSKQKLSITDISNKVSIKGGNSNFYGKIISSLQENGIVAIETVGRKKYVILTKKGVSVAENLAYIDKIM